MALWNSVHTPAPPTTANCNITILWCHILNEIQARLANNSNWSPNHFVPLLSPVAQSESIHSNQLTLTLSTPEKKTFKNNAVMQVRIPKFEASPNRRLRIEMNSPQLPSHHLFILRMIFSYITMDALLKGHIPKFSAANDVWLGDVPPELQGLTIPEEKLISLYRHNSCVIKLHSPFHSATTSQTALKGNCITFLQNIPSIVTSLPLALDDLCDTLK
ncbi:unnamed protein product, partial [Rotaria sordida]